MRPTPYSAVSSTLERCGSLLRRALSAVLVALMVCLALPSVAFADSTTPTFTAVTFHENDRASDPIYESEIKDIQTVLTPFAVMSPAFSNPGYTFVGWSTTPDNAAGSTTYADGAMYSFAVNVDLYAQWLENSVTFHENASVSDVATASQSANTTANLTAFPLLSPLFANVGHTFSGWNTGANGGGTPYVDGASYNFVSGSTSLYAQWTVNASGSVTFSANGASGTVAPMASPGGTSITLPTGVSLEYPGYTFAGWNSEALGNGTSYAGGASFIVVASAVLYAQWTPIMYVVDFVADGGSVSPASSTFSVGSSSVVLPTPAYAGYTFNGWYTASTGGTLVGSAGSSYVFSASAVLYAQWTLVAAPPVQPLKDTVGFVANGGTGSVAALTGANGTSVTLPGGTGLSNAGNTFASWNTVAAGTGATYNVGALLALGGSLTLYAQWVPLLAIHAPVILLGAVGTFASNSSWLSPALKAQTHRLAVLVKRGLYTSVTLYGYTNDVGPAPLKVWTSRLRATAVANFLRARLASLHIKGVTIRATGEGAIKNETSAKYRRVEVFVAR
jgi:uncharacterized repeat protein (TIGR02543 family)